MHQIDRYGAAIVTLARRLNTSDDAGSPAVRRGGALRAIAPFENPDDVFLVARKRNDIDRIRIVAAKGADQIARALTVAVSCAIVRAGRAYFFEIIRMLP